MDILHKRKCIPCEDKNLKPMAFGEASDMLTEIPAWTLDAEAKKISREFTFKNFVQAVEFVSGIVADVAEEEGHHPDIHIQYNKVILELYTHSIGGLSENDFIVAAKIDAHTFAKS